MNLEQLTGELVAIADSIEYNNKNHSNLNESILIMPPSPMCDVIVNEDKYRETGFLVNLQDVVNRLNSLTNSHGYNVNRTSELIKCSEELGQVQKGY
jgi:hypothetical protein